MNQIKNIERERNEQENKIKTAEDELKKIQNSRRTKRKNKTIWRWEKAKIRKRKTTKTKNGRKDHFFKGWIRKYCKRKRNSEKRDYLKKTKLAEEKAIFLLEDLEKTIKEKEETKINHGQVLLKDSDDGFSDEEEIRFRNKPF